MFRNLRSYFIHHRAERYGTIAVLCLCLLVFIVSLALPHIVKPEFEADEKLKVLIANLEEATHLQPAEIADDQNPPQVSLFNFDPNTLSDSGYTALGFNQREIGILRKYMAAGASFRQKDDFGRLYFMDDVRFDSIRPYLLLPEKAEKAERNYQKEPKSTVSWSDTANVAQYSKRPIIAELNTADTTELMKLPGVGSFYARSIVEYRESLGGFHNLGQLLELWKMTPDRIDRFADRVNIDHKEIVKIKVNTATTQRLSKHPYITFGLANKIVSYRESNGNYRDMNALVEAGLFNDELRLKLAPYLDFE